MDQKGFMIVILLLSFITVDGKGNTLNSSEALQSNDLLTSSNGRFQLGFFNATNSKTQQYLGIWYTDPDKTVVWVANQGRPITNGPSTLHLSTFGTLSVQDGTGESIWSTGSQIITGIPQACLLDTGILVINDTKTGKYLWQSLYELSDTLLPYVPLGYTKLLDSMFEIQLNSWNVTGIDPSPGEYVRKLDPSRRYEFVAFRGSNVTYRSGPWDGTKWNGFPKMTQDLVKFVVTKSGENGALFWYEPLDPSIFWRLVISSNGTTYRSYLNNGDWVTYWQAPDESTPKYALCGPYGIYFDGNCKCCAENLFQARNQKDWKDRIFSGGCERNVPLNDTHDHGFVRLGNVKLPDTINAVSDERKSESECASWCLSDSSCMAYAYIGWQGCLAWFGDIVDMQQFLTGGDNLYIRVASQNDSNNRKTILKAVLPSVVGFLVLLVAAIAVFRARKSIKWPFRRPPSTVVASTSSIVREDVQIFEFFDFKTILIATDDFSDNNIIGRGQLGPVYKGVLADGEEIAVKRLSRSAHNGNEQLENELNLLTRLKHKNLVKLIGFCIQQQEIILCFEFMKNRSLDQLLFGTTTVQGRSELNWEQRFKLIQGISSGLLYLHEDNGDTIIHRDVKPENILLDKNMVPKISDFGLARLFKEDRSFFTTSTIGGTRGYIAPELQSGMLSPKVDVYSFGMVILEIISGKRNATSPLGFVILVLQFLNEGRILDLKDARVKDQPCSDEEVKRCIHIALLCLLEESHARPSMRQINLWLTSNSVLPPKLPDQASNWGNIGIQRSTVVDSSALM